MLARQIKIIVWIKKDIIVQETDTTLVKRSKLYLCTSSRPWQWIVICVCICASIDLTWDTISALHNLHFCGISILSWSVSPTWWLGIILPCCLFTCSCHGPRDLLNSPLRWRHNGRDSVSNHQPHHCLLNRLFRRRAKKISKLRVTGLCAGNSPETGEFPAQRTSNAENVSILWRLHGLRETWCGACWWPSTIRVVNLLIQWWAIPYKHWTDTESLTLLWHSTKITA